MEEVGGGREWKSGEIRLRCAKLGHESSIHGVVFFEGAAGGQGLIDEVGELDEFVGEQAVPGGLQVSVVGLGEAQVAEFGEGVVPEAVVGEEGDTLCGGGHR